MVLPPSGPFEPGGAMTMTLANHHHFGGRNHQHQLRLAILLNLPMELSYIRDVMRQCHLQSQGI